MREAPPTEPVSPRAATFEFSAILFVLLCFLESSALVVALAIYKKGDRSLSVFLASPAGFIFIVAVVVLAASALIISYLRRRDLRREKRRFAAMVVLNLWSVILALAAAEILIRLNIDNTPAGPEFADTLLLPQSWQDVAAHNRALLTKSLVNESYLLYDRELGWTIGPNRRSKDYNRDFARQILAQTRKLQADSAAGESLRRANGVVDESIYLSSAEGLRSPRSGMSYAGSRPNRRIAIVGDSFTFGLEVRYEDTWGHQLELILGDGTQVLNFGVDGYGVDQSFLRYQRDTIPWRPDIVILGVINDDLRRTMCVFGFLCFPGGEIPFSKPRFELNGQTLRLLNVPLSTPQSLFEKLSIADLPFIEYDPSYNQSSDWEKHFYHHLISFRYLISKFPRWTEPREGVTDEALKGVNGAIFRSFLRLARAQGSIPIVVLFPTLSDFMQERRGRTGIAKEVLRSNEIPFIDMTDCVSALDVTERFVALHYSPATNFAIAKCLRDWIRERSPSL